MSAEDVSHTTDPSAGALMIDSCDANADAIEPYLSLQEPRLVLDLRSDSAFHQAHLVHSYHISPLSELKSRYSYLPPRNVPFLVVADADQYQQVKEAFSSTPSARLLFLSDSTTSSPEKQAAQDGTALQVKSGKTFFNSAQLLGLMRSSRSHRERLTWQRGLREPPSETAGQDLPELLFRPSNAVQRTVLRLEDGSADRAALRVLDLGCGAARDLAWILHGSRMRASSGSWTGIGVDNWKAVLKRAQQLADDLFLSPGQLEEPHQARSAPLCEKLLWAKCSDDGFLEPLIGTGKGKAIRTARDDEHVWDEYVQAGLLSLLPTSDYSDEPLSDQSAFDLILCIRFHPRALLPRLPQLVRVGGIILLSHFVTLSDAEREAAVRAHPGAIVEYDSPPHEGRIQPGEVDSLIQTWNQTVASGFEWIIDSEVLEPIEDGRIIKSVALRKTAV